MPSNNGSLGPNNYYSAESIYFAARTAPETAGIALGKADSFFNMLRANSYLEKLSRMSVKASIR